MSSSTNTNPKEGERWLRQASRDLEDAQLVHQAQRHNLTCFLAQQAGEKALMGYLYFKGAEDVWGHSLADLCEDAKIFDQTFELLKSVATLLDKYYVTTRYPHVLPGGIPAEAFSDAEAKRAISIAQDVITFVQQKIKEGS